MATDYDKGKVTDREKLAAERQKEIGKYNLKAVDNQLQSQLATYDQADKQNAMLRDLQFKQNKRKSETDRFEAQRQLQNAALGLFGTMNQAMNGSTVGNTMQMLQNRNDADNNTYWQQLEDNQNAVRNAYAESANQNAIARRDALTNALKARADIMADYSANLNNINPNLYEKPQSAINKGYKAITQNLNNNTKQNTTDNMSMSGYIMPRYNERAVMRRRNKLGGDDYYSQLINGFNF